MRLRLPFTLAILLVSSVVLSGCWKKKPAQVTPSPSPIIQEKVNTIDISERPYVTLTPTNRGRSLTLSLGVLNSEVSKGEFEVEYQSGNLLQGFGGRLNLEKLPDVQEFLLGSCSAGGKCSYSEDVTGGALTLRFTDTAGEKYTLKNEWSFLENKEKSDTLTSRDAKFVLKGKGLSAVSHLVVLQVPGYPAEVTAPLSAMYAPAGLATPKGSLEVSIRLNEEADSASILGWNGSAFVPLKTSVQDKVATATSSVWYESYIAVQSQ